MRVNVLLSQSMITGISDRQLKAMKSCSSNDPAISAATQELKMRLNTEGSNPNEIAKQSLYV
jgi:hypothetical protein